SFNVPGEVGPYQRQSAAGSTTIHIATNTTFAAIDDIVTARLHGSAAPPLPPHHRRQTATPPAQSAAQAARSGHAPGRSISARSVSASRSRRLIDPCGAESK